MVAPDSRQRESFLAREAGAPFMGDVRLDHGRVDRPDELGGATESVRPVSGLTHDGCRAVRSPDLGVVPFEVAGPGDEVLASYEECDEVLVQGVDGPADRVQVGQVGSGHGAPVWQRARLGR